MIVNKDFRKTKAWDILWLAKHHRRGKQDGAGNCAVFRGPCGSCHGNRHCCIVSSTTHLLFETKVQFLLNPKMGLATETTSNSKLQDAHIHRVQRWAVFSQDLQMCPCGFHTILGYAWHLPLGQCPVTRVKVLCWGVGGDKERFVYFLW